MLRAPAGSPSWAVRLVQDILGLFDGLNKRPWKLPSYTVADLPDATEWTGALIHVSDETGGAVTAFSDGTDWRRETDRAVVS